MNKLLQIVRLRQMLQKWRRRAQVGGGGGGAIKKGGGAAAVVPPRHVAVYVGEERVRFVVRTAHLHHPIFRALLGRSEQEFGFAQAGPLCIPCEAVFFEHLLSLLDSSSSSSSSSSSPPSASSPGAADDHLQELLDFYYSSHPLPPPSSSSPSHHLLPSPLAQPASA